MATKNSKSSQKTTFKETLVNQIDEYMDLAFCTEDSNERERYREAIRQMEHLLLTISNIE